MACTGPSRAMLPVVEAGCADGCLAAAVRLTDSVRRGCCRLCAHARGLRGDVGRHRSLAALARQPGDEGAWRPCRRSIARPAASGPPTDPCRHWPVTTSSPVMRFTRLPDGIGDVPDVGHLGRRLVLGRNDVAAQRVVGALVLAREPPDTRCRSTALVNSCWICLAIASGAPMMGATATLASGGCGATGLGAAISGAGGLLEPNKDPPNIEPAVSQPASPMPVKTIRMARAILGFQRRAAAASMVVTMTPPSADVSH